MAIFKDAPDTALRASVEIQNALMKYNAGREKKSRRAVQLGVGIHSGNVMLGIIGESMRMDQNVISDNVNIASRVQDLTRVYGTGIIITSSTKELLVKDDEMQLRYLGTTNIKGRKDHIEIYECLSGLEESAATMKLKTAEDFDKAIACFSNKAYIEALSLFEKVLKNNPGDRAAAKFIEWLQKNRELNEIATLKPSIN
jgi:adenylate cyclase